MIINTTNWIDSDFYGRKLPKEEEINSFFDCISTEPRTSSFFDLVPKHNYNKPDRGIYSRREIFPSLSSDQSKFHWITPHLSPCEILDHEIIAPTRLPPIAFELDTDISTKISRIPQDYCSNKEHTIKSTRDMTHIRSSISHFSHQSLSVEIFEFKKRLEAKKYIQRLSHSEIIDKVSKLREILPFEPIYILANEDLLNYLYVHCEYKPGQLLKNVWLIQNEHVRHRYSNVDVFYDYESAVFSTLNMKGSHEFEIHHNYQRGNRLWKVFTSLIYNVSYRIPIDPLEDPTSSSSEITKQQTHPRWGNLL